jgi:hypothetical protein
VTMSVAQTWAGLVAALAPMIALAAVVVAGLVLASTRRPTVALPVLLDLLLAAGLLRLTADLQWDAIASAALVVVIRKLASVGIAAGRTVSASTGSRGSGGSTGRG